MNSVIADAPVSSRHASHSESLDRYHALDFLRGALMFLGIAFHCAIAYDSSTAADLKQWPTSEVLGFLVVGSHGFRMPLFFILAGFFAALLFSRRTRLGFACDRTVRIGAPFLAGWLLLSPIVGAGLVFTIAAFFLTQGQAIDLAWRMFKAGDFFLQDETLHLWFLHYLLMFYAAMLLLAPLAARVSRPSKTAAERLGGLLTSRWRIPVLALPAFAVLLVRPMGDNATPASFMPDAGFLLLYGFFFAFGIALFSVRQTLPSFKRDAWICLLAGLVLTGVYKIAVEEWMAGGAHEATWNLVAVGVNALMIWLLFFGLVGVLLRYLNRAVSAVRYVADASYWSYLVHFPVAVWLPGLLVGLEWAPELKFLIVLATTTAFCFVTYELFVRSTVIGTVLNGRRYPSLLRIGPRGGPLTPEVGAIDAAGGVPMRSITVHPNFSEQNRT
jgi:glucan biosynthesis protein C